MPKGELVVEIQVSGIEPFKTLIERVQRICDEARVMWPTTGISEQLADALDRFWVGSAVDDQGEERP